MPLYEYRCKKCEHLEEVLQKSTDPAPAECPECGAKKSMAKEVSLTSFQLKGGGWYKDLYSSVPDKSGDSKEAKSGDSKEAKSDAKADKADKKKPETKGKSKSKKSGGKGKSKAQKAA